MKTIVIIALLTLAACSKPATSNPGNPSAVGTPGANQTATPPREIAKPGVQP